MGLCLCTENDMCFGEFQENQLSISKANFQGNNPTTITTTNNANEYTPMKVVSDEDINQNIFVKPPQNKKSNFNLYQKNNSNLSKDNVLFESFSYISKSIDNSSLVDYYQMSRSILEQINSIRINPKFYFETLEKIMNNSDIPLSLKELKETIVKTDRNTVYSIKSYLAKEIKGDVILWNEKVFLAISNYLIEVEEKCNFDPKIAMKNASMRVSERLNGNYSVVEFNLNGFYPPEICVWNFLTDNKDRLDVILGDSYISGAVCCFASKNNYRMRTLMYFVNKNSDRTVKLIGRDEVKGVNENMFLCDFVDRYGLEDRVKEYAEKITGGNYIIEGEKVRVDFLLYSGEVKEEIV